MKHLWLYFIVLLNHCLLSAAALDPIFKEYDIRGVVGREFQIEDAYDMSCAITTYLLEKDPTIKALAIGADGRIHSPAIKICITQALLAQGFNVIDIGTCTTPVLNFCMHTEPVDAGLMITASHNPAEYNGIKICRGKTSIFGPEIQRIRDIYKSKQFTKRAEYIGQYKRMDVISRYVRTLAELFPKLQGANIHALVDCGNGAAGTVMPLLVEQMQWDHVELLYPEVDGNYPHHLADPTVEKYMQDLRNSLLNSHYDLGIGFDGDCDRMAPMTQSGKLVKGDQLVTLLSESLLEQQPGGTIVFDVSSSQSLLNVIKSRGGNPVLSKTGFPNIKKTMAESNAMLGGEISCHTFFKDRYFGFDDGIYSMMRLFEFLQLKHSTLDELLNQFPSTFSSPNYRLACDRALCLKIIDTIQQAMNPRADVELLTLDGLRLHLPNGCAIIRPSNTEPVISMRFEGHTELDLLNIKQEFYNLINPDLNCTSLLD